MSRWIAKDGLVVVASLLAVLAIGFPLATQASILEEMSGEIRLQAPDACVALFDSLETATFGHFHVVPEGAGSGAPGSVSFSVGADSLTATWVGDSGARGVDPATGRPVDGDALPGASCTTGTEPDCWAPGEPTAMNTNSFDALCRFSKGQTAFDPDACGLDIFSSQVVSDPTNPFAPRVMVGLTNMMAGQGHPFFPISGPTVVEGFGGFTLNTIDALNAMKASGLPIQTFFSATYGPGTPTPLVPLSVDPNDGPPANLVGTPFEGDLSTLLWSMTGIQRYLTDEQEALYACGPFYGTQCDLDGPSGITGRGLMRTEVSALLQSWPRPDPVSGAASWDTTDASKIQPGTVGFQGEPVCTRYDGSTATILPGCRGPGDPGYDPSVDGATSGPDLNGTLFPDGRRHPFTNQPWRSEMAALSWNFLEGMVALSQDRFPASTAICEFVPDDPLRAEGCSLANPLPCYNVAVLLGNTTRAPEADPARPPLRRWLWETGAEYLVTEATGELEGFLGWGLFAFGPEQSRVEGTEVGIPFFLAPPDPQTPIPDSPLIMPHQGPDGIYGTEDDNFAGVAYGIVVPSITVEIDIKPGSDPNSVNPSSRGVIPVAILTTEDFDALLVDEDSVRFGPAEAEKRHKRAHVEDVDGDGDLDLLLHFRTQETGIAAGDTEACLIGQTYDGVPIEGCDSVRTVPPGGSAVSTTLGSALSSADCGLRVELTLLLPPLICLHRRRGRRS